MKIATLASICFAAAFAMAVAPAQTGKIRTVPPEVRNSSGIHLYSDYLRTEPVLMLVPYDPGILKI